jgi:hypothetical protein
MMDGTDSALHWVSSVQEPIACFEERNIWAAWKFSQTRRIEARHYSGGAGATCSAPPRLARFGGSFLPIPTRVVPQTSQFKHQRQRAALLHLHKVASEPVQPPALDCVLAFDLSPLRPVSRALHRCYAPPLAATTPRCAPTTLHRL